MRLATLLICLTVASALPQPLAAAVHSRTGAHTTALDNYIAAPDTNFSFKLANTVPGKGYTGYLLDMTSQAWLTSNLVNRTLWQHQVSIVKPDNVAHATALLMIGGGANGTPARMNADLLRFAQATRSVVAEVRMIPNQPLRFGGEKEGRAEDSIIAYTWDRFLRTGDEQWPARLPMTKAVVRAMDAVTAFLAEQAEPVRITNFVLSGASKRGWTAWSTTAVDKRVVAVAPIVIDVLNLEPWMHHHYGAYGFWAPAIGNYQDFSLMDWAGTPEYKALVKIEDPYSYRDRYTMPKLIINAAGDQYFPPDSSRFYFSDLPAPKYLRYVPNTDHSLRDSDARQTLVAWYAAILENRPLPRFSWAFEPGGAIRVTVQDQPKEIKLWHATNPEARDFRLVTIGPAWESEKLELNQNSVLANVPKPEKGWTAYFVELTYDAEGPLDYKLTTEVRIVPDVLPHKFVPQPDKVRRKSP